MDREKPDLTRLTEQVFTQVRTVVVLNMRFLDMAVFRLKPVPAKVPLATDGERLYFHPVRLLKRYQAESSAVTRDYLHVLLHCIFRHPFVHTLVDHALWDLACDMAVEAMICELHFTQAATADEVRKQAVLTQVQAQVKPLTAEKLYHHFQNDPPPSAWAALFHADEHDIWYSPAQQQRAVEKTSGRKERQPGPGGPGREKQPGDGTEDQDPSGGSDGQDASDQREKQSGQSNGSGEQNSSDNGGNQPEPSDSSGGQDASGGGAAARSALRDQLEQEWRDISEHVQMDLETFARQQGMGAGSLVQQLTALNRERYNYEAFLKKFSTLGEVMKINDDEFDYIFYTYGLKLFGNMPLIEPLEYKEVKRVREFVIAIDTSGSTSGELVEKFLTKTYNILMSTESFFSKVNIHIIQCDAGIQEDAKITSRAEFEDYIRHMIIRGLGGTDFRPVFSYVDQLVRSHEFKHLKGLIYFTDGYGTFPERMPEYKTAFVFIQDAFSDVGVPPWAIRLILEKDEM